MGLGRKERKQLEEITKNIESGLTGNSDNDMKYLDRMCSVYSGHELSDEILGAIKELRITTANKQVLEDIIKKIRSGLTGDREKDMKYLDGQSSKYSIHEHSTEILGAIKEMRITTVNKQVLEDIIKEISSGLAGDREKDMKYLDRQCGKYCRHESSEDILRAIKEMRIAFIPKEESREVDSLTKKQSYDEIIKEIRSGLTGDYKKDGQYLDELGKKYAKHEMGKEITREIGRMMCEILPPDKQRELAEFLKETNYGIDKAKNEATECYKKKDFKGALRAIEKKRKDIETKEGEVDLFLDDSVSEYHSFRNALEAILYETIRKPKKTLRRIPEDMGGFYLIYGVTLFELERFDESRIALKKAINSNPLLLEAVFELAEISKRQGEWEEYIRLTKGCFEFAYKGEYLSRIYRNLGFYFIEEKKYEVAVELFILSKYFEKDNPMANSELMYIEQETGKPISFFRHDDVETLFKKHGIQIGGNKVVLKTCIEVGRAAEEMEDYQTARMCYSFAYSMAPIDEIKSLLDKLPKLTPETVLVEMIKSGKSQFP